MKKRETTRNMKRRSGRHERDDITFKYTVARETEIK